MNKYSRRDFLKISSVSTAVAGATGTLGTLGTMGTLSAQNTISGTKTVPSICEMCSTRCHIEGRVENGKLEFIKGLKIGGNGDSVCARGGSGLSQLYDPQRLVKPLIRVGERGEGKFKEATYEEAFDLIAKRMGEIKNQYGAKSFIFSSKTGVSHNRMVSFANSFGSPNTFSHWSSCPITYEVALEQTVGGGLSRDYGNAKYILNFGHNIFEGVVISWAKGVMKVAQDPSAKLVVLEPRFSVLSAKADEWYAVKPGTDLAFVLALIHVWLRDGKYDKAFVEKYTVGIEKLIESTKDTTPQWQEAITGIKAEVVEKVADEIHKVAPKCIIDWGHKTTTGESEYQRTRAIIIANVLMGNLEKEGGIYFSKNASAVNKAAMMDIAPPLAKVENIPAPKEPRIDGSGEAGENLFVPKTHGVLTDIPKAILSKTPYEVKGWFMIRHNPLITVANPKEMKKAMATLDFIVVCDVYMSECAQMADVVLPEATYLERDEEVYEASSKAPAYVIRNKMVEPINNTKSAYEIFRTLAKRLGIDSGYTWDTVESYRMAQLKGNETLYKDLVNKGFVNFGIPPLLYIEKKLVDGFVKKYPTAAENVDTDGLMSKFLEELKTPSKKIEIFIEEVEASFPGYGVPGKHDMDVAKGFPYILTSGKTAIHTNGHTQNIPFLNMLMNDNPVWINPITAKKENIKNGDTVYLENNVDKEKAKMFVTEGVRPDTLFVYMGFGRESKELKRTNGMGLSQSKLLPLTKGPICGTMITNVGVKIVKA